MHVHSAPARIIFGFRSAPATPKNKKSLSNYLKLYIFVVGQNVTILKRIKNKLSGHKCSDRSKFNYFFHYFDLANAVTRVTAFTFIFKNKTNFCLVALTKIFDSRLHATGYYFRIFLSTKCFMKHENPHSDLFYCILK